MERLEQLFKTKKNILSVYFTAGFPHLDSTISILESLQKNNVDLVEIGFPFSDPLADGKVIQESSTKALQNGMSLKYLFNELKDIRKKIHLPLIMMGYLNPVLQFGMENFCRKLQELEIDGVILPDLPIETYEKEYKKIFGEYGIKNILLITPQTAEERIRKIDALSQTFIYMVSSSSTTGTQKHNHNEKEEYFSAVKNMELKNPVLAGFGIHNRETFLQACKYVNGGIIGSAYIKELSEGNSIEESTRNLIKIIL